MVSYEDPELVISSAFLVNLKQNAALNPRASATYSPNRATKEEDEVTLSGAELPVDMDRTVSEDQLYRETVG